MSLPLVQPTPSRRGVLQSFVVPRAAVDGTLTHEPGATHLPTMTAAHWAFYIYVFSCVRGQDTTVWAGTTAARNYCGITDFGPVWMRDLDFLWGPLEEYGLAVREDIKFRMGRHTQHFSLMIPPVPTPAGLLKSGRPASRAVMKELSVAFVTLPADLMRGPWAQMSPALRRCLCALYAFLAPNSQYVDPNHVHVSRGVLVASEAFQRAAGGISGSAHEPLLALQTGGLLYMREARLTDVPLYPGGRPPLVVTEGSSPSTHVFVPALLPPAKRKRRGPS